jgi:predicted small metal-binding protein
MAKVYLINFRDAGVDCDFQARGSSLDEVMQLCVDHGVWEHNMKESGPELYVNRDRVAQDQALGHVKTLDRRWAGPASSTRQFAIHPDFGIIVNAQRQHDLRTRWIKGTNPGRDRQRRAKPQEGHFAAAALRLQFGWEDDGPRRVVETRVPSVRLDVVGGREFRHGVRNRRHFNDFCLPGLPLRAKNG